MLPPSHPPHLLHTALATTTTAPTTANTVNSSAFDIEPTVTRLADFSSTAHHASSGGRKRANARTLGRKHAGTRAHTKGSKRERARAQACGRMRACTQARGRKRAGVRARTQGAAAATSALTPTDCVTAPAVADTTHHSRRHLARAQA